MIFPLSTDGFIVAGEVKVRGFFREITLIRP